MKKIILFLTFIFIALKAEAVVEFIPPELPKGKEVKKSFNWFKKKELNDEERLLSKYKKCTEERVVIDALELLDGTAGEFSKEAILGNNLSEKPVRVEFANLANFNPTYANYDALGWKKKNRLYIYINQKHKDAPKEALAAVLAHEAVHQDELNSLNEETYAWTLEAVVWAQLIEANPEVAKSSHPLVDRQNLINKLFVKGNYTDEYIRKSVVSNLGYQNLPTRSPGFEDRL